jgi:hypothetical protein
MWHPASLLISWAGFAWVLQWLSLPWLLGFSALSLLLAALFAPLRSRRLLWRSRWLLLSLAALFLFFTPGEYVPGFPGRLGLTFDGLEQAALQLGRLLAMLVSLALLHEHLGTQGLVSGLYWLMRPFSWCKVTVVRLMLVLEFVEQKQPAGWREWLAPGDGEASASDSIQLSVPELQHRDRLLIGGLVVVVLMVAWQ